MIGISLIGDEMGGASRPQAGGLTRHHNALQDAIAS